jgi:hypothetical protein
MSAKRADFAAVSLAMASLSFPADALLAAAAHR